MVTNLIILICILIFIYIHFISHSDKYETAMKLGALYPPYVRNNHEYYRLFTNHFIHIDFLHCFMNVYCIYALGSFFESLLGTMGYIVLILCSMLTGSLMTMSASSISNRVDSSITIGASGIFYGYLGAMIALAILYNGIFMDLLSSYASVIVINFALTLFNKGISKTGHFGGALGGFIAIVLLMVIGLI